MKFLKKVIAVLSDIVSIISDWIGYVKEISDKELEFYRKEDEVDYELREKQLEQLLIDRRAEYDTKKAIS